MFIGFDSIILMFRITKFSCKFFILSIEDNAASSITVIMAIKICLNFYFWLMDALFYKNYIITHKKKNKSP